MCVTLGEQLVLLYIRVGWQLPHLVVDRNESSSEGLGIACGHERLHVSWGPHHDTASDRLEVRFA